MMRDPLDPAPGSDDVGRHTVGQRTQLGLDGVAIDEIAGKRRLMAEAAAHPRLVADRRAADAATEHHVPRSHRRAEAIAEDVDVGRGELVHGVDAQQRQLACRLGADAPQRLRRAGAHHLEPVLGGQPIAAGGLGEGRGGLRPQLVVADADRAVQAGVVEHRPLERGRQVLRDRRCRRRPPLRPIPRPRPRRESVAACPSPRSDASSYAGLSEGRKTAVGQRRAAARSAMPERTPNARASYDAVATTWRGRVGSPSPPTITGRPTSSGWRSTSTAARNWSRSTWRNQRPTATIMASWGGAHDGVVGGRGVLFRHDGNASLPMVSPPSAGAGRSRSTAGVLLATVPAVGLGGPPARSRARPQRGGVGRRPHRPRRAARPALRPGLRGAGHRRRPRRRRRPDWTLRSCVACCRGCWTRPDRWLPRRCRQFRHDGIGGVRACATGSARGARARIALEVVAGRVVRPGYPSVCCGTGRHVALGRVSETLRWRRPGWRFIGGAGRRERSDLLGRQRR